MIAKTMNGATPRTSPRRGAWNRWLGSPAPTTGPGLPGPASGAISMAAVILFHVRTNGGIPLLGDHLLGGILLLDGGEHSLGVVLRRRQGIQ